MRNITIQQNDAGQRLDKFLQKLMPTLPKSLLYKFIRKKRIKYNGGRCKGMEILSPGDELCLYINDEFFQREADSGFRKASGIPDIVYEDKNILIVYKPSGQYAHSCGKTSDSTLIDQVKYYLCARGEYRPEEEQTFAPALCNRIDRNTEGLVIAAKHAEALRTMNEAIRERRVHKCYLAVTAAPLPKAEDTCTAWLKKDSSRNMVRVLDTPPDRSWQQIRTKYRVLAGNGSRQLVHITLLTGRTHQIRAHLAHLHAPLLGDPKYGADLSSAEENQCLCAYSLTFTGLSGTRLSSLDGREITAPLPSFVKRYFPAMTDSLLQNRVQD